jgi:hypothetical protein
MATSIFHEPDKDVNRIKVICSSNERRGYEKRSVFFVHPLFNGEGEWPQQTTVVCRYDGEPFDSIPIPLPIDHNNENNTYVCYGIFCSAACVKAFMENNPVYSNALSMIWLKKIMCEVFGDFDDIVEAPPIDLLIKNGGELTIEQFRKFGRQKTRIITHRMPFFTCALAFELVKEYGKVKRTVEEEGKQIKKLSRQLKRKNCPLTTEPSVSVSTESANLDMVPPVVVTTTTTDSDFSHLPTIDETHPSTDLLPASITLVPSNVGNRWEIRGLKRPTSVPDETDTKDSEQSTTNSLFKDYLDTRNKTKEGAQQQQPHQHQPDLTNPDNKPQKRRGRPKSTKSKPDSPKSSTQGTLVSFLK